MDFSAYKSMLNIEDALWYTFDQPKQIFNSTQRNPETIKVSRTDNYMYNKPTDN